MLALLLALQPMTGDAGNAGEYELKAAMLFKFTQFTDWPGVMPDKFKLCVYGNNPFGEWLHAYNGKMVRHASIVVAYPQAPAEFRECQVLFVDREGAKIHLPSLEGLPILTVSDDPEVWDDNVMLVFVTQPNRIGFNVNRSAAQSVGIQFRAQMLLLANSLR